MSNPQQTKTQEETQKQPVDTVSSTAKEYMDKAKQLVEEKYGQAKELVQPGQEGQESEREQQETGQQQQQQPQQQEQQQMSDEERYRKNIMENKEIEASHNAKEAGSTVSSTLGTAYDQAAEMTKAAKDYVAEKFTSKTSQDEDEQRKAEDRAENAQIDMRKRSEGLSSNLSEGTSQAAEAAKQSAKATYEYGAEGARGLNPGSK